MKLLDSDVMIRFLRNTLKQYVSDGLAENIIDEMKACPTAVNAVKVVRCKDCKYWSTFNNGDGNCEKHTTIEYDFYTSRNDYCSYGERKEK